MLSYYVPSLGNFSSHHSEIYGQSWLGNHSGYLVIDLPVCPDKTVSGSGVESLLGYTVLIEVAQHLYGLVDTFLLYTGYETL